MLNFFFLATFPSLSVMKCLVDAAVTRPDHVPLHESSLCVIYELQWCQYVDCWGLNRVTTHIFSVFFENSLKIPPSRKVSWRRAKCSVCTTRRVRVSGDAVGAREFHSAVSVSAATCFNGRSSDKENNVFPLENQCLTTFEWDF